MHPLQWREGQWFNYLTHTFFRDGNVVGCPVEEAGLIDVLHVDVQDIRSRGGLAVRYSERDVVVVISFEIQASTGAQRQLSGYNGNAYY